MLFVFISLKGFDYVVFISLLYLIIRSYLYPLIKSKKIDLRISSIFFANSRFINRLYKISLLLFMYFKT